MKKINIWMMGASKVAMFLLVALAATCWTGCDGVASFDDAENWKYTGEYFESVFQGFPKDEGVVYKHLPHDLSDFGLPGFALALGSALTGSFTDSFLVPIKVLQASKQGNLVTTKDFDRVVWVETKRRYEDGEELDEGYYIRRGWMEYENVLGAEKRMARYVEVTDKGILAKIQKQIEDEKRAQAEAEEKAKAEAEANARAQVKTKTILLPGGVEMEMVWCSPGTFTMGEGGSQHRVTVTNGFWMAKTEVTQAQWESVMGTSIRQQRDKTDTPLALHGEGDAYPMYYVCWNEAREFCRKTDLQLPTEAQWEYACRAGNTGKYAGSGKVEEMGWYTSNVPSRYRLTLVDHEPTIERHQP